MIHIILGLLLGQATAELVHVSIAEEVIYLDTVKLMFRMSVAQLVF